MSEHNGHGRREAVAQHTSLREYWQQHRAWVANLGRGQKIRYRLFQALVVFSLLVIAVVLALSAWMKLPNIPNLPGMGGNDPAQGDGMSYDGAELPDVVKSGRKEGYYTFLLVGQDVMSGGTDTIFLVTYDTKNKTVNAISLLRDTMINTSASSKRLNAVYTRNRGDRSLPEDERVENGMTALKKEVSKLTGIYPDFYVLVQWEAIGALVEAIGGVHFEVPFDMDYDDPYQDLHIHQKAGYRLLNGEDAMEVIRFRKNNDLTISLGDAGRTEIQRNFMSAVLSECLQPDILLKLPALAQVFLNHVDTDLSVGNILAFAQLAIGMDVENNVKFVSMPWTGTSYHGASMVLPIEDELLALLNDGFNPYVSPIKASDLQLMYQKSNGGYGVTNGVLADPSMGNAYVPPVKPQPETPEEPETPIDPESPEIGGETVDPNAPVDPMLPTPIDPNVPVVPEGGESGESSSGGSLPETPGEGGDDPSQQGGSELQNPDPVLPDPNDPNLVLPGPDGGAEDIPIVA